MPHPARTHAGQKWPPLLPSVIAQITMRKPLTTRYAIRWVKKSRFALSRVIAASRLSMSFIVLTPLFSWAPYASRPGAFIGQTALLRDPITDRRWRRVLTGAGRTSRFAGSARGDTV